VQKTLIVDEDAPARAINTIDELIHGDSPANDIRLFFEIVMKN
jgi:hypothetical protein